MKTKLFVNLLIPVAVILIVSTVMFGRQDKTSEEGGKQLQLHFIDVGQGDCTLARLPGGRSMLVDAGSGIDAEKTVKYIKNQNIHKIDILVATHPHEDHIGAMDDVVREFEIGDIYMPKATANTKAFENLLLAIKSKGLKVNTAKAGVILIDEESLKAEFIAPISEKYDELNNFSAVTKITYGQTSFLLCGDAEELSENEILKSGARLISDVLKVAHHGSNTSSVKDFISAVSPKVSVISVGEGNPYYHPHKKTLNTLEEIGSAIYRTDEKGTIVIISDGINIKAGTEK